MATSSEMIPEREAQYKTELLLASPKTLALAQILQTTAFLADEGKSVKLADLIVSGKYVPAPLYLSQATSLMQTKSLRKAIIEILK